jgi:hypothetical protein
MSEETAPLDIEIIYDPVEEAHREGLVIDATRHRVMPDSEFVLWAKRHYKRPTLFEYHHLESDNIVLCDWLIRGKVAQELEAYPHDQRPDRAFMDMRVVLCDKSADSIRRKMRRAAESRQEARDEAAEERQNAARHLKHLGLEAESRAMAIGQSSFMGTKEGGQNLAMAKEELANLTRNRIITSS